MAYNSQKGPQHTGDIQYEGDPNDVQIDFENDQIILKTGGAPRVSVVNTEMSASGIFRNAGPISGSGDIAVSGAVHATTFYGSAAGLTSIPTATFLSGTTVQLTTGVETSGYLKVSGSSTMNAINATTISGSGTFQTVGASILGNNLTVSGATAMEALTVNNITNVSSYSGSGTFHNVGAATFSTNVSATGSLSSVGLYSSGFISGSSTLLAQGAAVFGGVMTVSGNVNIGGPNVSNSPLYVQAPSDNSVVAIFKSPSHDAILAMTGSGQVAVGGLYLAAKLNITGSDIDKLISAKSDSADPAFYVSGSGDAYISGSLRAKQLYYTTHKFTHGSDGLVYLRFDTVGIDTGPTNNNKMVAPHNGKLNKVVWRFEGAGTGASSTTAFSLHAGVTNQQQIQATPVATVNLTDTFIDDTTYTATFSDTAIFASGDIVGASIDPAFNPGITVVTCVWEFDQNN
tara:strand:+ start:5443 stop:6816 length:1374 start_codon:yes stop_codon:yes gene_type:complete